ncbi:hypothetical protein BJV82DRAFT_718071 [Fennellomyces sp. T-0311]|nr:hypothetical protein BJV82DRAFT_718071 [Fennellomyces sp. T-0311]
MELKSDLEQWRDGCIAFDNKDYDAALRTFMRIGDNARMHFNIGLIFIILQDHRRSLAAFKKALEMDPFFAVACFQRGVSYFSLGDVAKAYEDFDLAYQKLRGNTIINYHQLGLSFRLYECEVLFNRGICQLYLGRIDAGLTDLYYAQKTKVTTEHDVIDEAVRERGKNFSVYSIPQGVLFRPSETKMERMRRYQEFHGDTTYIEDEPKRQNSVLLPPSAPWMQQEVKTTTDAFLVVPRPHRPQQARVLDDQRSPSPEEPDPFMRDPVQQQGQMDPFMREQATFIKSNGYYKDEPMDPVVSKTGYYENPVVREPAKNDFYKKEQIDPQNGYFEEQELMDPAILPRAQKYENEPAVRKYDHRRVPSQRKNGYYEAEQMDPAMPPIQQPTTRSNSGRYTREPEQRRKYDPESWKFVDRRTTYKKDSRFRPSISSQADYTGTLETMSYFGDSLDEELDKVYASLNQLSTNNNRPKAEPPSPATTTTRSAIYKNNPVAPPPSSPDAKIKIKVHHDDTRILLVPCTIMFDELLTRVRAKFNATETLRLQYKDEEGVLVLMIDQEDLNMARHLSLARNTMASKHPVLEKLELWCVSSSS